MLTVFSAESDKTTTHTKGVPLVWHYTLTLKEYKTRPDWVGKVIHRNFKKFDEIPVLELWRVWSHYFIPITTRSTLSQIYLKIICIGAI